MLCRCGLKPYPTTNYSLKKINTMKAKKRYTNAEFKAAQGKSGISRYKMAKDLKIPLNTLSYQLDNKSDLKVSVYDNFENYLKEWLC